MYAFIHPEKCLHCQECGAAKVCPIKAIIRIDESEPNIVDPKYCRGCGDCVGKCNAMAISLKSNN